MTQDEEHLRLLAIFHYVVGGICALFGLFPVIHLVVGLTFVFAPHEMQTQGGAPPPALLGWFFVGIAATMIIGAMTLAALLIIAGRFLSRRKRYMFCFVVACVECIFMPFGTVLGVFTIIVLTRESVKQLFAANSPTAANGS